MARAAALGSVQAIHRLRSTTALPEPRPSLPTAATTLAGPLVSALAFAGNWSARAEWDYIRLQNQSFTVANNATAGAYANDTISVNNRSINMFTAGLNYKFGGGWW